LEKATVSQPAWPKYTYNSIIITSSYLGTRFYDNRVYVKLDLLKIEFQNRDIMLNSFKTGALG